MGPAALLDYDRKRLRGLVLEEGGPNSHVAIVARALGIAAVGEIDNATGIVDPGDAIIVDGSTGDVHVRPVARHGGRLCRARAAARAPAGAISRAARQAVRRPRTARRSRCMINAGLAGRPAAYRRDRRRRHRPVPHRAAVHGGGDASRASAEQFSLYRAVLDAAGDKPVTFRTLDIGGDKVLPYMRNVEEENPALGWRAIRLGLDRPGLLRSQIRALLRAAGGRELQAHVPDDRDGRGIRRGQGAGRARADPSAPPRPQAARAGRGRHHGRGAVAALPARRAARRASISSRSARTIWCSSSTPPTAAMRASPTASIRSRRRSCARSRTIADKGREHGKPVTLCGELASQPIGALALVAIGYRSLSLAPSAVGPVKAMLLDLDAGKAAALLDAAAREPGRRRADPRAAQGLRGRARAADLTAHRIACRSGRNAAGTESSTRC